MTYCVQCRPPPSQRPGSHYQRCNTRVSPPAGRFETNLKFLESPDPLQISRPFALFKPSHFPAGRRHTHAEALIFGGRSRINNYLLLQPQSAIIQDALEACSKSSSFLVQLIHPGSTKFWSPSMWPGVRQSLGNKKLQKIISHDS